MSHWAGCPGTDVRTDRDGTYCGLCGTKIEQASATIQGAAQAATPPAVVAAKGRLDRESTGGLTDMTAMVHTDLALPSSGRA